ncbi:MAG: fibronectin type III domain-containing protein [Desulfobacteraceae bacterium]|nr:fibronectin type III domain-containing protein [Desulfobacteraceae bacterium]MBC2756500.1 fibronectin type III domain-containing protein [Desulfobacteraceae bacterium]
MKCRLFYRFLILLILSHFPFAAEAIAGFSDVPTDVTLTSTTTTITVSWNGDSDARGYYIYYGTSSDNLDTRIKVEGSSTNEYTITSLKPDTTYFVAVSSYDFEYSESGRSGTESIKTLSDSSQPATPTGFEITDINDITNNSVSLKWDKNTESDLDHYNIYYATTSGSYDTTLTVYDSDSDSFTVSGLTESLRYYFTISAVDTSGNESGKAEELIIDTLIDYLSPYRPAAISGVLTNTTQITVTIENGNSQMADYTGNILYYGEVSGNLDNSVDLGDSFSYVLNDLSVNSTWYFAASSYDYSGNESVLTNEISVLVEETVRFLNQPDDFDGGCFISSTNGSSHTFSEIFFVVAMMTIILLFSYLQKYLKFFFMSGLVVLMFTGFANAVSSNDTDDLDKNIIGVSVGYYIPSDSEFTDFYGEDIFPVYGFYERFFFRHFSMDVETGFMKEKGHLLTESGEQTGINCKITIVPVSASIKYDMNILPNIVGYVGIGPDYWYCQEETEDKIQYPEIEEWVGGFHGKIGVRLYNTDEDFKGTGALLESSYSQIDRFGDNKTDIGGWAFKFGFFYHF